MMYGLPHCHRPVFPTSIKSFRTWRPTAASPFRLCPTIRASGMLRTPPQRRILVAQLSHPLLPAIQTSMSRPRSHHMFSRFISWPLGAALGAWRGVKALGGTVRRSSRVSRKTYQRPELQADRTDHLAKFQRSVQSLFFFPFLVLLFHHPQSKRWGS